MKDAPLRHSSWHLASIGGAILFAASGVAGRAVAAPIKVACVGDNMTHSDLFSNSRETQPPGMQEYPRKLQDLMGSGYDVRNFGDCCASVVSGYPSSETHPYVSGSNYKNAAAFLPDIVIIGPWGRHDWGQSAKTALSAFSVANFQKGYEDLINKFQTLSSKPKIYVSSLVPLPFGMDGPDGMMNLKTSPQSDVVTALAEKYNLPIIDLFTAFTNQPTLFIQPPMKDSDGEHTSDLGSTKIAQMVAAALKGGSSSDGGVSNGVGGHSASSTGGSGGHAARSPDASSTGSGGDVGATGGAAATGGSSAIAGTGGATSGSSGGFTGTAVGTGGSSTLGTGGSVSPGNSTGGTTGAPGLDNDTTSGCACGLAFGLAGRARWQGALLAASGFVLLSSRRRNRNRSR